MIGDDILNILIEKEGRMIDGIVFLPYCHAMWDCMKSVYESCIKHNVPCGVMPIPYFGLKHGMIDEWHYEYDMYVNEIPEEDLLDFNDFDKLDFSYVVIHNAYDDRNTVTTIHPFFYSDVLKEKGKKIIFIPYGIPNNGVSNDLMRIQKGTINADYIFVNGVAEREGMIESFDKIGIDMRNRCYATGSPKLDAILSDKQYELPIEWKAKIMRPVVIVCTSLVPFMKNPIKKIEQYRSIVERELKKGYVVIFRPHPLMEETIKSKCIELWDSYMDLMMWLSDEQYVIIGGGEVAREFQVSYKLISDPSSMLEMWKETEKPYEVM